MHRSRRQFLNAAAAAASGLCLRGAEGSGSYYRDYSRCLPDYLTALSLTAYEKRNQELARLTNAGAIRARQHWATEAFWRLIGGQPERTSLNPRTTGQFEREGYRLEKIVYESRPRVFVTANLYVPTQGQPPYPGILFHMGHSLEGKSYASYQKCCQGLARLGFVVLAFDPMGQGERIYYPDATGAGTLTGSADNEHSQPGKQLLLLGNTATQFQVWDAMRSLDYLAAHPSVDPARLGSTGQSGGATITMFLACVDPRLSAAVVSLGNTENVACPNFNPPGSTDDAEQDLLYSGPVGFDRWDVLYPLAPKPLLVMVSEHDFYGTYSPRYIGNGQQEFSRLAKVYELLGHRDRIAWNDTPLPHSLGYDLRLATYNWFQRWLNHSDRPVVDEPAVAPEKVAALWTGSAGNVIRDYNSRRPIDLIREDMAAVHRREPGDWRKALRLEEPAHDAQFTKLRTVPAGPLTAEAVEVRSAPQVWVPAWMFSPPRSNANGAALLMLDDRGRNLGSGEDGVYRDLALRGHVVCAADLRGIGDMRPEVGRGNPRYEIAHAGEEDYAWGSLILGKSLLAQRVEDIRALLVALRNSGASRVMMFARGQLTIPALFAFHASPDTEALYLAGGLASYRSVLETEMYRQPLASLEWNLFRITDLPLVAAACSPRRIHLAGTRNAGGGFMSPESVRDVYALPHVTASREAAWDASALGAFIMAGA